MKNWSTEDTRAVKAWMNIENYKSFEDTTLNALYHELWARALLFKPWPTEEEKVGFGGYMRQIFNGKPMLFRSDQLDYMEDNHTLQSPPHVFITDITRLAEFSITALRVNLISWEQGSDEYGVNLPQHDAYVSTVMSAISEKTVLLEIDLASGTDDEIAESIKSALPQWRRVKGIKAEMSGAVRFGYGTIKKIISYRLIAMLDMLLWAKMNDLRISDDRLSRLLYTDEDDEAVIRLHYHIKEADRPLAMKAATIDFIRQFNFFINRNQHLKNMRVSEVMKLSDSN
ncbi:DUF6387 family protein [Pantoea agglomerans]|uniref:DUF6387 family protein n=1 Tax=Enterobacter agglomerans TaxID=549 RepID=UPI00289D8841|nr:DUF6387 family protein [Pantoea agglomerans]WNK36450.1 DUF6387 family protein [Pantoea agglomerans]